jgi:hypothetical protein
MRVSFYVTSSHESVYESCSGRRGDTAFPGKRLEFTASQVVNSYHHYHLGTGDIAFRDEITVDAFDEL